MPNNDPAVDTALRQMTDDYWVKKDPYPIFRTSFAFLWMLWKNYEMFKEQVIEPGGMRFPGGYQITIPLQIAGANTGNYGVNTVPNYSRTEQVIRAVWDLGGAWAADSINLDDTEKNAGIAAKVDIVKLKLKELKRSLIDRIATQLMADASADSIAGVPAMVGVTIATDSQQATSTDYGGFSENDNANWRSNVTVTAQKPTRENITALMRTASFGNTLEMEPNLIITTRTIWDRYAQSQQAQQIYKDAEMLHAGFDNIIFGATKAPMVADDRVKANYMWVFNTRHLFMFTDSRKAFSVPEWRRSAPPLGQPDTWYIESLWRGQLCTDMRKAHAVHTNFSLPLD